MQKATGLRRWLFRYQTDSLRLTRGTAKVNGHTRKLRLCNLTVDRLKASDVFG